MKKQPYITIELTEKQTEDLNEILGCLLESQIFAKWIENPCRQIIHKIDDAVQK